MRIGHHWRRDKRRIITQTRELFLKGTNNVVSMFKKGLEDGQESVCFVSLKCNLYLSTDEQIKCGLPTKSNIIDSKKE